MPMPAFHVLAESYRLELEADARRWDRLIEAGYHGSLVVGPRRGSRSIAAARRLLGAALIRFGGRVHGLDRPASSNAASPTAG